MSPSRVLALCVAGLACAAAQEHEARKPGLPGLTPSIKSKSSPSPQLVALGRMREALMQWYCPKGAAERGTPPCKTHAFLKTMKATKDPAEKKKLLTDRQAKLKALSPEERTATAKAAKGAYSKMYGSYCAEAPHKATEVCTSSLLKNLYGDKIKSEIR